MALRVDQLEPMMIRADYRTDDVDNSVHLVLMEPRELRLFQMFSQLQSRTQHYHRGLGIGLMLARTLVELHAGTITASSEGPGKGSEFIVRLPVWVGQPH